MKKIKIKRQHGLIMLLILILSSSLTAFMYKPIKTSKATLLVQFNDFEYYEVPATTDNNTTLAQAISESFYIRLDNGSIHCIRQECNGEEGTWLTFTENGVIIDPMTYLVSEGEKLYVIYNATSQRDVEKDNQAIMDLLKL